jgi:hypothetical protein
MYCCLQTWCYISLNSKTFLYSPLLLLLIWGFILKFRYLALILIVFVLGWFSSVVYSYLDFSEKPFGFSNEVFSPSDWIKQDQIKVLDDKIVISIENATWAQFADTNSMDPVLDIGANSLQLKPSSCDELKVGDIISYHAGFIKGVVVHRIVSIGEDEEGWYAITKGDNNRNEDPEKVRFSQVKGVLVGVLY